MYHVEELPDASSTLTPGWTYVADTGFDPAQAAIAPSLGRKRGVRGPARGDLSSRQKNAIVRHLAELDRENHRDVAIPVKAREGK
ncbi:HIT finger domain protein, partial [Aspergillus sp. HF37]